MPMLTHTGRSYAIIIVIAILTAVLLNGTTAGQEILGSLLNGISSASLLLRAGLLR